MQGILKKTDEGWVGVFAETKIPVIHGSVGSLKDEDDGVVCQFLFWSNIGICSFLHDGIVYGAQPMLYTPEELSNSELRAKWARADVLSNIIDYNDSIVNSRYKISN